MIPPFAGDRFVEHADQVDDDALPCVHCGREAPEPQWFARVAERPLRYVAPDHREAIDDFSAGPWPVCEACVPELRREGVPIFQVSEEQKGAA